MTRISERIGLLVARFFPESDETDLEKTQRETIEAFNDKLRVEICSGIEEKLNPFVIEGTQIDIDGDVNQLLHWLKTRSSVFVTRFEPPDRETLAVALNKDSEFKYRYTSNERVTVFREKQFIIALRDDRINVAELKGIKSTNGHDWPPSYRNDRFGLR